MEQLVDFSETVVEPVEDQNIVELPLDVLDKIGGGTISLQL